MEGVLTKNNGDTFTVIYMVLGLCPEGELFDVIANTGLFPQEIARFYFRQMMEAILHMQERGISH
jgi:serine/threonine protein kinase